VRYDLARRLVESFRTCGLHYLQSDGGELRGVAGTVPAFNPPRLRRRKGEYPLGADSSPSLCSTHRQLRSDTATVRLYPPQTGG
jgi:hypothetical protein